MGRTWTSPQGGTYYIAGNGVFSEDLTGMTTHDFLEDPMTHSDECVYWNDPDIDHCIVLRLLGDSGPYSFPGLDISYCYVRLKDGTAVRCELGTDATDYIYQFRDKRAWKRELIAKAKADGVYAKGLGFLDNVSIQLG